MTTSNNPFHDVLKEAREMRLDGILLNFTHQIESPVVALHGDYDPLPIAGVREPLPARLKEFRILEIEHCGQKPWIKRQVKDKFCKILKEERHDA